MGINGKNKKAIGIVFAVIIAVSVFAVAIPSIASESNEVAKNAISSSDLKAKNILMRENLKSNLTDAQKKLSTDLLQLLDSSFLLPGQDRETLKMQMERLGQFRPASSVAPKGDGSVADDLVYLYVYLKPPTGTQAIEPYVWEVTDRDEENHLAVAWVEVKDLETLASLEAVRTIRTVMPPRVRTGSVTTEGDAIHRTSDVRATYSQSGSGVKVGIISDGVDHRATAQSSGDLPASLTVLNNRYGGDEGTAMLEIVHDMVPAADLYFHDCGANTVEFNAAIDALVAAGCDVICDDIGWITEPFFEDGIIASHLTSVLASNDIIYVSSAGNAGQEHYQGDYYNDGYDFHDFSRGSEPVYKYLYVEIPNNGEVTVVLQWNDEFGFSDNDYDLYLYKYPEYGEPLAVSTYTQDGYDDPIEAFSYTNTGGSTIDAEIDVYNYAATTKTLEVYIYPSNGAWVYANNINASDSIFGHAAVPNAIAVGAIAASDPGNDDIEDFSSQGPVTISYPSSVSRTKPDLCGIDGVTVTGAGGFPSTFYGTSAAAPHVAAIAAQLWGAYPERTGDEIRTTLCSSAVDLGSSGYDYIFGYGRADALDAYEAIAPPTQPDIWVDPTSFELSLLQNTSEDYTLEIGNEGNATLTYDITDKTTTGGSGTAEGGGQISSSVRIKKYEDTQAAEESRVAPINSDFLEFLDSPPEPFYGYIPPPMDLSHIDEIPVERMGGLATQPSNFDWRDTGKVTSVKDQNPCGTCWIFGTTSVLESAILIADNTEYNFSEQSVALCVDRSWVYMYDNTTDPCMAGGNSFRASGVFIKKGAVLESCNPYNTDGLNCDGTCVCDSCPPAKRVNGYRYVTGDKSQTSLIKDAVYNQGPVTMAFYYGDAHKYTDATYDTVYDCAACEGTNHIVSIIGWDDNVPHFETAGTGAWLVKNSWGTGWGNSGYFWLAYNSSCMTEIAYLKYEDYDPNEELYYRDEAGWVGDFGNWTDYSGWMANTFTSTQDGNLTNVDFWTTSNNAQYVVYVYRDGNISNGLQNLATSQSGTCQELGYYSIPLTNPVSLTNGEAFTIAVKMTTLGYKYPIPAEYKVTSEGKTMVDPPIQSGKSFFRHGDGESWTDGASQGCNFCLRGKVSTGAPEGCPWLDENPQSGSVPPAGHADITVTINTAGLTEGDYNAQIVIANNDPDENPVIIPVHLTVAPSEEFAFDTGRGTYPSISGMHNGTITPAYDINVSRMYTYPCTGTGGHSKTVVFSNATTGAEIANGTWTGYQGAGDYHYIEFDVPFILQANETYNYTIRTGSYPQIHHTPTRPTANGWINCTKFTDANGKEYDNWIPAIKLE